MPFYLRRFILGFLLFSICLHVSVNAQKQDNPGIHAKIQLGAEVQWYPAGWLIGPVANYLVTPKHIINIRASINIADRHNWSGLNDDEKGIGFGGSIGYRYLFRPTKNSFFVGARTDLFNTKIKWQNKIGTPQQTSGTTTTIVLQPSAELGYWLKFKNKKWNLLFAAGVGEEINIKTTGRDVGQGGMWLLSISIFYSL